MIWSGVWQGERGREGGSERIKAGSSAVRETSRMDAGCVGLGVRRVAGNH